MGTIQIKGQRFGAGKPVICVPVMAGTKEGVLEGIRNCCSSRVPMIEWRMDYFKDVLCPESVTELLFEINELTGSTVLLCTFRSRRQGGELDIAEEEYKGLLKTAAKTGAADMIDLEYFEWSNQEEMIRFLQEAGSLVVASQHDFEKTPDVKTMTSQLLGMHRGGADFAKLAVMPGKPADVLRLMEAVLAAKETALDSHMIAMSMGPLGMLSRAAGEWFGSEVTFASLGKASAPGQLSFSAEQEILRQMHEICKEIET